MRELRHRAGFIGLQRADEVPFDVERGQFRAFLLQLLHIVFPEGALAGKIGLLDIGGGKVLLTASNCAEPAGRPAAIPRPPGAGGHAARLG